MKQPGRVLPLVFLTLTLVSAPACEGENANSSGVETVSAIAFIVNRSGFGEIWVMDENGRNRTRLTSAAEPGTDATGSISPAWSPDGTRIAFASSGQARAEERRDVEIYVMRADGSEITRLTEDRVFDADPAWAPDGTNIAFAHFPGFGTEDGEGVIVIMDPTGENRTQISRHPDGPDVVFDASPAWSPDGALIAFTRTVFRPEGQSRTAIHTIDPTGNGERLLIADAAQPARSPDGRMIAFTSIRDRHGETCFHDCSVSGEIYIANADGTGLQRLTTSPADDHSPAWAPDGRHLAFVSDRSDRADHENEIYFMNVDGGDVRRITTNGVWDLEPTWR